MSDYDGVPYWADYFSAEVDVPEDIKWLCEQLKVKHYKGSGRGFFKTDELVKALKSVVKRDIEGAMPMLAELNKSLADGNYGALDQKIWEISDQLDSKSGFHFYIQHKADRSSYHVGGYLGLLDNVLRFKGDKVYIGGIVDYHS